MHKHLAALVALAVAFAGCSGGDDHAAVEDFTCPDGQVVPAETIEEADGHHDDGFNATSLCPEPPQLTVTGLPGSLPAFSKATFTWTAEPGAVQTPHSMLMSMRYATASVDESTLDAGSEATMDSYPTELLKKEHQDLPATFEGSLSFSTVQTVYLRAFALVKGEGYDERVMWSDEHTLVITPVNATGTVVTVTKSAGLAAGELTADDDSPALGDAVRLQNDDLVPLTLTLTSSPQGADACTLEADPRATSAASCLLVIPGQYTFTSDDLQPKSITLTVAQPA